MKGQFSASNMSLAARQAAKAEGLAMVDSYDVLSHISIRDEDVDNDLLDVVVIRAYSPKGRKSVDLTAGQIYFYKAVYQDAPAARVV